jgi:cytochrome c556
MKAQIFNAVALSCALGVFGNVARANEENVTEYRQHLMVAIGGHMAAVASIVKGRLSLPEHIAQHAELIGHTAKLVPSAFEDRVVDGPTDAKPEIWVQMDQFTALNSEMAEASLALAEAARTGDARSVALAMRDLGKTCGSCHQRFRKPKEESYKQPR